MRLKPKFSKKPFQTVQKLTQNLMNRYMKSKKFSVSTTPIFPTMEKLPKKPEIPKVLKKVVKPKIPKAPKLTKDRFETTSEFHSRIEKEKIYHSQRIKNLQIRYRKDVEKRNENIKRIQVEYNQQVENWNKTVENIENRFLAKVENYKKEVQILQNQIDKIAKFQKYKHTRNDRLNLFTEKSFFAVMGNFEFKSKDYNADKRIFQGVVFSKNAKYSKKVEFSIEPNQAKKVWSSKINPKLDFQFQDSRIELEKIEIAGKPVKLIDKIQKTEIIQVSLKNEKVKFSSDIDLQITKNSNFRRTQKISSNLNLNFQNSNLDENYKISEIQEKNSISQYSKDLETLLAKTPQANIDKRKWAFIIGVEKYRDAENVPFSKRSSEMFKKTIHKSLGVPERNIYTLIDSDATTTRIKDKMRLLISNVKNGDIIYFYYSGHGVPEPKEQKAFILPSDKIVDFVYDDKNLQLDNIYKKLTDSRASKVIAFIDSCFSGKTGAKQNQNLFKGKGTAFIGVRTKTDFDKNKMVVITAGGSNDFSNMYKEKGYRMFSYFLIKDILKGKRDIGILHSSVKTKVYEISNELGDSYRQTPQIDGNIDLSL